MMKEVERIFRAHEQDGRVRMQYWTRHYFRQLEARLECAPASKRSI